MKADEARKLYFEKYVEFENNIRTVAHRFKIKTKNMSLREMIDNICNSPDFIVLEQKATILKQNKRIRNWLAHSNKNATAPKGYLLIWKSIDALNSKLRDSIKKLK